ncbi:MAG: RagB/SusD family nutrient uptake outer membrane protein, partial [Odoribacter sp.]|nr:RagB/SusD family nutrient uptake outer membrane protein [Odoribacter sp.]
MKNTFKLLAVSLAFSVSSISCSNWLDVKMSDKIMENSLYATNNGYMIALNGVYLGMLNVYGEDLSVGMIDVMAQYYNMVNGNHRYKVFANYSYGEQEFKNKSNNIWTRMYALIANVNTLLDHCDEEGSALRADYYPIIKGEALALRAMMHFDLLRLYGPSYNEGTASVITIPYQETAKRDITPLLPAEEVLSRVIRDLKEASDLLKDNDPIFTTGVGNGVFSDDGLDRADFTYRQLRLNYFAVQTLLARAYLWKGEKGEAYRIVKEEIIDKNQKDEEEMIFPWTTQAQVEAKDKNDLLFSSEVFFAVYHSSRSSINTSYFSKALQLTSRLTFVGTNPSNSQISVFYDDPSNDWRSTFCWAVETTSEISGDDEGDDDDDEGDIKVDASSSLYLMKYDDAGREAELDGTETYFNMIPLIRLSEAYLIAAECAATPEESLEYLTAIREHRNCHMPIVATSEEEVRDLVTKEFAREVIGEGQLFFYYKRLN